MHWSSWSEFFHMGGYGLYVWGSYGVTLLLLGGEVISLWLPRRTPDSGVSEARPPGSPRGVVDGEGKWTSGVSTKANQPSEL